MVVEVYSGLTSRLRTISHAIWLMENSDDKRKELVIVWPITKDCHISAKKVFSINKSLSTKIRIINYKIKPLYKLVDVRKEPIKSIVHMVYNLFTDVYSYLFGAAKVERLKQTRDSYDYEPPTKIGWEGKEYYNYILSVWYRLRDRLRASTNVYIHAYCGIVLDSNIEITILYGIDFLRKYYVYVNEILANYKREHLVGVHIRRTDHKKCIENSPLQLFIEKMDKLVEKDKQVCFLLATDDKNTQEQLIQKYGEQIIVQNKVWGRDSQKAMVGGIIDCLCLSKCKMILGSYSSVSSNFAAKCGGIEMISMIK